MRLSAKSTYAIRAMYDLVTHSSEEPISIRSISLRAGISSAFLCQIFNRMRRKGLLKSVRGAHGGYILAKHPQTIKIRDIIAALEEPFVPMRGENSQPIRIVWGKLRDRITEVLSNTSLADVCRR